MIAITEQMRQRVLADRAELRKALGERALSGYAGAEFQMVVPCPRCEAEGCKTYGGYTPRLAIMVNTVDGETFAAWVRCHTHGEQPEPLDLRLAMDHPDAVFSAPSRDEG